MATRLPGNRIQSATKTHTLTESRVCEWRNTVEIIVSSGATDNKVIDRPRSCILSFGTN